MEIFVHFEMKKLRYSSGLPELDNLVGGFFPGDTSLIFLSFSSQWTRFIEPAARFASGSDVPVSYIASNNNAIDCFTGVRKLRRFEVPQGKIKPNVLTSLVKRFALAHPNHSFIILDELSLWKKMLAREERVCDLLDELAETAQKKKSLLICAAD